MTLLQVIESKITLSITELTTHFAPGKLLFFLKSKKKNQSLENVRVSKKALHAKSKKKMIVEKFPWIESDEKVD